MNSIGISTPSIHHPFLTLSDHILGEWLSDSDIPISGWTTVDSWGDGLRLVSSDLTYSILHYSEVTNEETHAAHALSATGKQYISAKELHVFVAVNMIST